MDIMAATLGCNLIEDGGYLTLLMIDEGAD